MNRHFLKHGLKARGSEDLMTLEGKVSNQKLVRDEVVFQQSRDRDLALLDAIRRLEAQRRNGAEVREEDNICA